MKLQMHLDYKEKQFHHFVTTQKDGYREDAVIEAEETAAQSDVLACPFCGSEPELYLGVFYERPFAAIQCKNGPCKVKTQMYSMAPNGLTFKPTPMKKCVEQAVTAWNRRTPEKSKKVN